MGAGRLFIGAAEERPGMIRPDVRGVKQLDHCIGGTFVSSVREEVAFALIDFQD
jgi:hypothetical protein